MSAPEIEDKKLRFSNFPDLNDNNLLKVASAFPSVTFIWKYEKKDEFALGQASKIENLVLTDWMPQNDLLSEIILR